MHSSPPPLHCFFILQQTPTKPPSPFPHPITSKWFNYESYCFVYRSFYFFPPTIVQIQYFYILHISIQLTGSLKKKYHNLNHNWFIKLRHIHIQTHNSYKNYLTIYIITVGQKNFNKISSLETPCTVFILINKK